MQTSEERLEEKKQHCMESLLLFALLASVLTMPSKIRTLSELLRVLWRFYATIDPCPFSVLPRLSYVIHAKWGWLWWDAAEAHRSLKDHDTLVDSGECYLTQLCSM